MDLPSALKVALSKYSPTTPGATLFGKIKLKVQGACVHVFLLSDRLPPDSAVHVFATSMFGDWRGRRASYLLSPCSGDAKGIDSSSCSDDVIFLQFSGQKPRLSTFFEILHPSLFDNMPVAFRKLDRS